MSANVIDIAVKAKNQTGPGFNSADRSATSLTGKMRKLGKAAKFAAAGLAVGAVVAGKALFGMAQNAMADEAAQRKLAIGLRNTVNATDAQIAAVERYISKTSLAKGITDDELRPAFQRLVQATGSVTKAQRQMDIAMDVSAGTGKSLKVVTEALMKANNGSTASLSKLGLKTKDAKGETLSLDDALKSMSKTFEGQASAAANTTEGKFNRLKIMLDETKESIGAKLIPVAVKLADWMLKMAPTVSRLGSTLKENLGPPMQAIGEFIANKFAPALRDLAGKWLEGVRGMIDNVGASMQDNKPFIDQLVKGFQKLGEFLISKVMPALGQLYLHAFPLIGQGIGVVIAGAKKLTTAWLFMAEWGVKAFRFLLGAALSTFSGILHAADAGLGWIPKLGDKIHDARVSFDKFKDSTIANLDKTAAKLHDTRDAINGIKSPKPIKIDVETNGATLKLAGLQRKVNGMHGTTMNIYANILTTNNGPKTNLDPLGPPPRTGSGTAPRTSTGTTPRAAATGDDSVDAFERAFERVLGRMPIMRVPDAGNGAFLSGASF